jgi:hypothetical protein
VTDEHRVPVVTVRFPEAVEVKFGNLAAVAGR